tara:strand:- start:963 stop:1883 length:921 start_codon:yes stop_codon:yes gene_type:complete
MTEAVNQQEPEEQPQATPEEIVQPQEVDDAVFDDLYRQTVGMPQATPEVQQPQQEQVEPQVDGQLEETAKLQAQVNQLKGALAMSRQQANPQSPQGQQEQQTQESLEKQLLEANPDVDPNAVKWMIDTAGKIAEHQIEQKVNGEIAPLKQQLAQVSQHAAQSANERILNEYETSMNDLANQAGVQDEYTRNLMKDAVAARGQREYGQNFSLDHAKKLFRDINNERLQQGHQQQSQYVAEKQNMQSNAPPQQHAEGATSSIESIQNQIRDPKNKNMDLRSDGFQETVKRFLNAGDNAVNSMLGGNKR